MLALTRQQVRAVDRLAIGIFTCRGFVLMRTPHEERRDVAMEMLGSEANQNILILCGGAITAEMDWRSHAFAQSQSNISSASAPIHRNIREMR